MGRPNFPSPPPDAIFLLVPFAEKEQVKQLGARWNKARSRWWVTPALMEAHPQLSRWLSVPKTPEIREARQRAWHAAQREARQEAKRQARLAARQESRQQARPSAQSNEPKSTPREDFALPDCDCHGAPWEDCTHTLAASSYAGGGSQREQDDEHIAPTERSRSPELQ